MPPENTGADETPTTYAAAGWTATPERMGADRNPVRLSARPASSLRRHLKCGVALRIRAPQGAVRSVTTNPGQLGTAASAAGEWALDDTVTYLDHGSFGACLNSILAVQRGWRDKLESEPSRFLGRDLADQFVGMYVNHWTLDYGGRGREAIERFLGQAEARGLIPGAPVLEFVG